MRRRGARPVREAGRGNPPVETPAGRPGPTSPPQGAVGLRQGVSFGDDRGARRRHQGAGRARGRVPRVGPLVGRFAARCQAPRHARSGAGRRGRCTGVLEGDPRCVPRDPRAALLVAQDRQCPCRLPKSAHPGAKKALAEIYNAADKDHARIAAKAFEADFGAKWPKAVAKIADDLDVLLAFYDYPAEHWIHLRTTNPIVIWSSLEGVFDARHGVLRCRVLLGGRGYLQWSRRQSLRRDDASCPSHLTGLVA